MANRLRLSREQIIVVAAAFLTLGIVYPVQYTFSLFLPAVSEDMGWGRAVVSGGFAILFVLRSIVAAYAGALTDRISIRTIVRIGGIILGAGLFTASLTTKPWHLTAAYGLLVGPGVALCGYVPVTTAIKNRFDNNLSSAIGFATVGIGLGVLVFSPIIQAVIIQHGWRTALRVNAVIVVFGVFIVAAFLETRKRATTSTISGNQDSDFQEERPLKHALAFGQFWMLFFAFFGLNFGVELLQSHQVAYLLDINWSPARAALSVSIYGFAAIFMRPILGMLSDSFGRRNAFTLGTFSLVFAVFFLFGLKSLTGWLAIGVLCMFDLMLATATSTRANLYPAITLDVFPGFRYGALYGVLNIGHGLGGTLGVIVGGLVFDMSGSYFSSLLIVIALAIIAGVLLRSVYKPSNRIITQTDPLI